MTRAQAFSLLGVEEDASEADIRSAYRYVFSGEADDAFYWSTYRQRVPHVSPRSVACRFAARGAPASSSFSSSLTHMYTYTCARVSMYVCLQA